MIGAIENAILKRIWDNRAALGGYVRAVASYGGEFDNPASLAEIVKQFPCFVVAFVGCPAPTDAGANRWEYEPIFAVMAIAKNYRNEAAQRQGAGTEIGTYQMVRDARELLAGQKLDLDLSRPLYPGACRQLFNGRFQNQRLSIMSQEFTCRFVEEIAPPDATQPIGNFVTFHADWDIPVFTTQPNDPLPLAADRRDAEDSVSLPQS